MLLAFGRPDLAPFIGLDDIWFLVRALTPPDPMPLLRSVELLHTHGPFDLTSEPALLAAAGCDRHAWSTP